MIKLKNVVFFNLLSKGMVNDSNFTELQEAYDEFIFILHGRLKEDRSSYQIYYELGIIRLELFEQQNKFNREGKKCLYSNNKDNINN